jgi:hypothetical protein
LTFDGLKKDIFKRCEEIFVSHQAAVTGFPNLTMLTGFDLPMLWIWIRLDLDLLDKCGSGIIFPDLKPNFWLASLASSGSILRQKAGSGSALKPMQIHHIDDSSY